MTQIKRAALYTRVSSVAQGEDDKASIPEQTTQIQKYCADKGYAIADQYIDIGYSGATKRRPRFQDMLTDAREEKFDVIVCWKSDRLSRGMFAASDLMETIEPLGIGLEAVKERIDLNIFAMYALVGKFELDDIRARTRFGREARIRIKQLLPCGGFVPYGLKKEGEIVKVERKTKDGKTELRDKITNGKFVIEPEEAKWIKNLYEWVADGKSAYS